MKAIVFQLFVAATGLFGLTSVAWGQATAAPAAATSRQSPAPNASGSNDPLCDSNGQCLQLFPVYPRTAPATAETFSEDPAETVPKEQQTRPRRNTNLLLGGIGALGAGLLVGGLGAELRYGRDSSLCSEQSSSHCPEVIDFYRHVGTMTMWAGVIPALAGVTLLTIGIALPAAKPESTTLQPIKLELAVNPSEISLHGAF